MLSSRHQLIWSQRLSAAGCRKHQLLMQRSKSPKQRCRWFMRGHPPRACNVSQKRHAGVLRRLKICAARQVQLHRETQTLQMTIIIMTIGRPGLSP